MFSRVSFQFASIRLILFSCDVRFVSDVLASTIARNEYGAFVWAICREAKLSQRPKQLCCVFQLTFCVNVCLFLYRFPSIHLNASVECIFVQPLRIEYVTWVHLCTTTPYRIRNVLCHFVTWCMISCWILAFTHVCRDRYVYVIFDCVFTSAVATVTCSFLVPAILCRSNRCTRV